MAFCSNLDLVVVLIHCGFHFSFSSYIGLLNLKWTVFAVSYYTGIAWVIATLFYQTSRLTVDPANALMWLGICIAVIAVFITVVKKIGNNKPRPRALPQIKRTPPVSFMT